MSRASELADTFHISSRIGWRRGAVAELTRLERVNAEMARKLNEASNYIDVLGGTSKSYRAALTSATKEQQK